MPNETISYIANTFYNTFVNELFGSTLLVGIFVLGLVSFILFKLRVPFPMVIIILIPLIILLSFYGLFPYFISYLVIIALAIIFFVGFARLMGM